MTINIHQQTLDSDLFNKPIWATAKIKIKGCTNFLMSFSCLEFPRLVDVAVQNALWGLWSINKILRSQQQIVNREILCWLVVFLPPVKSGEWWSSTTRLAFTLSRSRYSRFGRMHFLHESFSTSFSPFFERWSEMTMTICKCSTRTSSSLPGRYKPSQWIVGFVTGCPSISGELPQTRAGGSAWPPYQHRASVSQRWRERTRCVSVLSFFLFLWCFMLIWYTVFICFFRWHII